MTEQDERRLSTSESNEQPRQPLEVVELRQRFRAFVPDDGGLSSGAALLIHKLGPKKPSPSDFLGLDAQVHAARPRYERTRDLLAAHSNQLDLLEDAESRLTSSLARLPASRTRAFVPTTRARSLGPMT